MPKVKAPARTQELIFLDSDDDLGTVRSKLESSPADEIFLVVPRKAMTLRTPLEYRILARMAHELSGEVIIVSPDAMRRQMARQEGLRIRRGYRGVRRLAEAAGAPRPWLPGIIDWLPLPSPTTIITFVGLALLLAAVALLTLPEMRVTVTPETRTVKQTVDIVVDPGARAPDVARAALPGEDFKGVVEVNASVPTSGQRNVGAERARGEIVFTNRSGTLAVVPKGNVVIAKNGVRFLTDQEVRIPPYTANQVRVAITAETPGVGGNLGASEIQAIEGGYDNLGLTNPRPTAGGTDRPARAVADEDVAKLKEELAKRAVEKAASDFRAKGGGAKSVPITSVKVQLETEKLDQAVGAQVDSLTGRATYLATATGWDNQALNELVQRVVLARNGGELWRLPLSQLRLPPPNVLGAQDQKISVRMEADATLIRALDPDVIQGQLRGKSYDEAVEALRSVQGLAGPARVEVTPVWAPRAYRVDVAVAAPK